MSLQASLEALSAATAGEGERLRYHIGSSFAGETSLEIGASGDYELWSTVTEGRRRREFGGRLAPERFGRLLGELVAARVWEARPVRERRRMDDPVASIGVGSESVEVPASEIPEVPC